LPKAHHVHQIITKHACLVLQEHSLHVQMIAGMWRQVTFTSQMIQVGSRFQMPCDMLLLVVVSLTN
jgi:hypothetical protein